MKLTIYFLSRYTSIPHAHQLHIFLEILMLIVKILTVGYI